MRRHFCRLLRPWTRLEFAELQLVAVLQIKHEVLLQPSDRLASEQIRIDLEIAEEASHIHIRRSDRRHEPVHDHDLRVDEAFAVAIDADARLKQVLDIGERRIEHQPGIRLVGEDDSDIHAAQRRSPQSHQDARVGNEVRRRDVELVLGGADGGEYALQDGVRARIRSAGDDLDLLGAAAAMLRKIGGMIQLLPGREPPVPHEHQLQIIDRVPFNPNMRVPPEAQLRVFAEIFVPDVDASDEPDLPVDDDNLPMVPEVDALVEEGDARSKEALHLHASVQQLLHIGVPELHAADSVVNDSDLDAFGGFAEQHRLELAADLVMADRIIVEMNVMAGRIQRLQDRGVGRLRVGEDLRPVAAGDRQHREAVEQVEQPHLMLEVRIFHVSWPMDENALPQRLELDLMGDDAPSPDRAPRLVFARDEVVHDKADDGQHEQDEQPGDGLARLAVLENEDRHDLEEKDEQGEHEPEHEAPLLRIGGIGLDSSVIRYFT